MERDPDPALAFFPNEAKPDLYHALGLNSTCSESEIKSAYKRFALKFHPDKISLTATEAEKDENNLKFQQISYSYGVLKDEERRKRYDESGRTDEMGGGKTEAGWKEYFNSIWTGEVNASTVEEFKLKYQGSEEEKVDLFECYNTSLGSLETIVSTIMCSTFEDEDRFIKIINTAIKSKSLPSFPLWSNSIKDTKSKQKRKSKALKEATEAETYAKAKGIKLSKNGDTQADEDSLKQLIQGNQAKRMDSVINNITDKYTKQEENKKKKRDSLGSKDFENKGKAKKAKVEEVEPSEEEFLKMQKEIDARRKSLGGEEKKKKKGRGSL